MSASDDGLSPINVVWVPARIAEHEVGVRTKNGGTKLSRSDRETHARADALAREAAGANRVPKWSRDRIFTEAAQVSDMAMWLARVTQFANHFPFDDCCIRDTTTDTASRWKRSAPKRKCQCLEERTSAAVSVEQAERVLKCPMSCCQGPCLG